MKNSPVKNIRRGEKAYVYKSGVRRGLTAMLDALGWWVVRVLTLGRGMRPNPAVVENPKKILVIRLDHLGDVLFIRPGLLALKTHFPQAKITVLTSRAGSEIIGTDRYVDKVLVWEAPWFARAGVPEGQGTFFQLVQQLRKEKFDISLDFRGDIRHHIITWLAGVRVRLGYGITGGRFLLHRAPALPLGLHEVDRNLALMAALHVDPVVDRYVPIPLTPEEIRFGQSVWPDTGKRVVMHPAAGDSAKQWPVNRLIEICDALGRLGCDVMIVGTSQERFAAEALANACIIRPRVMAGKTDLRQLAAMISAAVLMVGSDSGPAHMAVTQGIPTIMLWSQTNEPGEWGPWGRGVQAEVVREPEREQAVGDVLAAAKQFLGLQQHR
jgi:heptosyltransferase-2/heptosyltransferase-3